MTTGGTRAAAGSIFRSRNATQASKGSRRSSGAAQHYLLALCEGNGCRDSHSKRKRGQGRIHVLERRGRMWHPVARIKLPKA